MMNNYLPRPNIIALENDNTPSESRLRPCRADGSRRIRRKPGRRVHDHRKTVRIVQRRISTYLKHIRKSNFTCLHCNDDRIRRFISPNSLVELLQVLGPRESRASLLKPNSVEALGDSHKLSLQEHKYNKSMTKRYVRLI